MGDIVLERLSKLVAKWARPGGEEAHQIYQVITASARHPEFYRRFGIADTLDGRFDTLTLMAVLVIRRIKAMGEAGEGLGQDVVDLMFADLDLSLHEIGVSENKVGRVWTTCPLLLLAIQQMLTPGSSDAPESN